MAGSWDQSAFDERFKAALASKIAAQQAQSNLQNQQAAAVVPLAQSQIRYEGAMGGAATRNAQTNARDAANRFALGREQNRINAKDTDNRYALGQERNSIDRMDAENRFTLGMRQNEIAAQDTSNRFTLGNRQADISAVGVNNNYDIASQQLDINRDSNDIQRQSVANTNAYNMGSLNLQDRQVTFMEKGGVLVPVGEDEQQYMRGTARVPGKGSGDMVKARLEPGEAVLNRKAADMIGRDKIAAANKKGNEMRAKQSAAKLAQVIKMLGMA